MAEEKKKTTAKKSTTSKKTTSSATKKTTPKKKPVKKENTVIVEENNEKEVVTNKELKEQNKELRSDVKKYKLLMILLIILMIISVISQGLKFYAEYIEENDSNKISIVHSEALNTDSEEVQNLYKYVSMFKNVNAGNYMGYFYEMSGATVDSISDEVKVYMGLSLTDLSKYNKDDKLTIPKKTVKKNIEKIFGKDVSYKDVSLGSDNLCYLSLATFNSKDNTYEVEDYNKCNGTYQPYYGTMIESASKYSNRIEIVEKVYYGEYENNDDGMILNVYKQADTSLKDDLVATLPATDLDEKAILNDFKDVLYSYKYTFYLEKGNYYLHSVERTE